MGNRTGTYVAFDGLGESNPTMSDFKYYATLQAWSANKDIKFNLIDSHDKTYSIRDDSKNSTFKSRINERLSMSKNIIVILTENTRKGRNESWLSYEIEQACDVYKLPFIICYPEYNSILNPRLLLNKWPHVLKECISNGNIKAIHIPFNKNAIFDAIDQFSIVGVKYPKSSTSYYTRKAQESFGIKF